MTLRKYYKTEHWRKFHYDMTKGDDTCCEICGCHRWEFYKIGKKKGQRKPKPSHHMHLHHKNYDHMMCESRDDIMILCDSCHKFGHMLEKVKNKNEMYKKMYDEWKEKTGWEFKRR